MSDELGAISVGLRVDMSKLNADLGQVKTKAKGIAGTKYLLNFGVGTVNLSAVEREIRRIVSLKTVVTPKITANRATAREFRADLQKAVAGEAPIPIKIKANLAPGEVTRIRSEIIKALGAIPVTITAAGGGGRGGGGGVSTSGPVTPHERRVADDLSTKVGRQVRQRPTGPVGATSVGAAPAGGKNLTDAQIIAAARRMSAADTAKVFAQTGGVSPAQRAARPAPAAPATPAPRPATRTAPAPGFTAPGRVAQIKKSMAAYGPGDQAAILDDMESRGLVSAAERADVQGHASAPAPARRAAPRRAKAPTPPPGVTFRNARAGMEHDIRYEDGGGVRSSRVGTPGWNVAPSANPPTGGNGPVERRKIKPDKTALPPGTSEGPDFGGGPGAARRYQRVSNKQAERGVSPDTLSRRRAFVPETAEEKEYAERTGIVGAPLTAADSEWADAHSTGVRGAGRAGLRRRGRNGQPDEEALTEDQRLNLDMMHDRDSAEISAARNAEVRAPSRSRNQPLIGPDGKPLRDKSGRIRRSPGVAPAFYGGAVANPRMSGIIQSKQMAAMGFGAAYDAYMAGDMEGTRVALRGRSQQLSSQDQRQRKSFFRMFRDIEKSPPELVEQHAALGAIFKEVALREAANRTAAAEAERDAFQKPSGKVADWPEAAQTAWQGLLSGVSVSRKMEMQTLQGLSLGKQGKVTVAKRSPAQRAVTESLATVPEPLRARKSSLVPGSEGPETFASSAAASAADAYKEMPGLIKAAVKHARGARAAGRVNLQGLPEASADEQALKALLAERRRLAKLMKRAGGGYVEGRARGGTVATGRIHGTYQWRQMSQQQRAFQPFCTYCQTFGSKENPLEGDHIKGVAEGGAPFDKKNVTTSCKRCNLAKRGLTGWGPPGRAGGGLMDRMQKYRVGENRDETYVSKSGHVEVIPYGEKIRSFPEDGEIIPYVPQWVRRMQKNAKELSRATGGTVKGAPAYAGKIAAEPGSGLVGTKQFRLGAPGEREAIAGGLLGKAGGVSRVFVVNWPAGGTVGGGSVTGAAPRTGQAPDTEMTRSLKKLLRESRKFTNPKEPDAEGPSFRLTEEEKLQSHLVAIQDEEGAALLRRATNLKSSLSETTAQSPVRSLGPSVGQILGTWFGRGELLKRLAVAREDSGQAERARTIRQSKVEKLDIRKTELAKAVEGGDPKKIATATERVEDQQKAVDKATESAVTWADKAEKSAKHADAFSLKLRTMLGNTLGITGGMVLFSAAMGAAQQIIEYMSPSIERVTDKMSGYQTKANEVTKELSAQIRAHSGLVDVVLAEKEASISLGTETGKLINPLLGQRAQIEAGNLALKEQIDLIHAYQGAQKQQGGQKFPIGLTETQGGLNILGLQTGLGGTRSTFEQMSEALGAASGSAPTTMLPRMDKGLNTFLFEGLPGFDSKTGFGEKGNPIAEFLYGTAEKAAENNRKLIGNASTPTVLAPEQQAALDVLTTDLNENVKRAGGSMKLLTASTVDQRMAQQKQVDALLTSGIPALADFGKRLAESNLVLGGVSSDPAQIVRDVLQGGQDAATGASMPDLAQLLKAMEKQIAAQKGLFDAEGRHARATTLPATFALSQMAAPTAGLKGGAAFEAGLVAKDENGKVIDLDSQKAAAAIKGQVGGAINYLNSRIDVGKQAMLDLVAPLGPEKFAAFSGLLGKITDTGKQISDIQIGMQQEQTNVQVAAYNNQLRIARRSLQDAKDLQAAIKGEVRDTVGGLEGANVALSRQLQLLGFEMSQRQINFKLATAGFVAPGTTPEERAARIEFAKKEASFAQKQLDLSKQIASNQYRGTTMKGGAVERQITDLKIAIGQLTAERTVVINLAVKGRALAILQAAEEQFVTEAQTYIEEGQKIVSAYMTGSAQVAAATGEAFGKVLKLTAQAWTGFGVQATDAARRIIDALSGTATSGGKAPIGGNTGKTETGATGLLFDTTGPTNLTVGEAGKETIAVLRNPRQMSFNQLMGSTREYLPTSQLGAGVGVGAAQGGGVNITVVITGNSISKDTDLHRLAVELAEEVSSKVEDKLMRKASLFGLRR